MANRVGIVLVNYGDYAEKYLAACRDSLRRQDYPVELYRVYIVDNSSSQESREYLKSCYPEALVLTREDGNYAAAVNRGFQQAIGDGAEYLVSVNMDTEMAPSWLSELAAALDNNPRAGLAQSKIFLYPKSEEEKSAPRLNSLGNAFHFLGFGFTTSYQEPDREIIGYPIIKGYASGCSFIIRRVVWEKIGGHNEEYYMYHDDVELGLKVRLADYDIILAPRSIIYHKYEFSRSIRMVYYMERNRRLVLFNFYPLRLLVLLAPLAILLDAGLLAYSYLGGWSRAERRALGYFFLPHTYAKIILERRRIKKMSVVQFSNLARDFAGRIEFQEVDSVLLRYVVNPLLAAYWRFVKIFI